MNDTLLIIEDEKLLGSELKRHFLNLNWEVFWVESIQNAKQLLVNEKINPLVVLSDMLLPDGNGLDLLEEMRQLLNKSEWIFLTGYGGVADSVRGLRLGAFDFLTKPCEPERIEMVVKGAARSTRAQRRLINEATAQSLLYTPASFIGKSNTTQMVRAMLSKLIEVPFSALVLTGETGTGKGLAAKILHHAGLNSRGPFISINCAALPRELLESELFGHEAGAFTSARARHIGLMEQANSGTLFLDEISEMDLDLQAKLLKAIEDQNIRRVGGDKEIKLNLQIITATNQNLELLVEQKRFRADLYHRLCVFCLHLPALRDRKEDLEELVPLFIDEYNVKAGKKVSNIPQAVWERLTTHHWPGNVRELRNVIERCVLFATSNHFPMEYLSITPMQPIEPMQSSNTHLSIPLNGQMGLDDMEQYIINSALKLHSYNVAATARALNTTRETLRYRIQKYKISGIKHN
jgi:DNA-binding NtrC family response regulator